jgi:hypothetical protein
MLVACAARHLLAAANKASSNTTGSTALHTSAFAHDAAVSGSLPPPYTALTDYAPPPDRHTAPSNIPTLSRQISASAQAHAGAAHQPVGAQEDRESLNSGMTEVVWVPDKGLAVPVPQDCNVGDAATYRERWEQSEAARRMCDPSAPLAMAVCMLRQSKLQLGRKLVSERSVTA